MGTRGAYGFIADGEMKLAYNHWDSYPENLGRNIAKQLYELCTVHDSTSLKALAAAVTLVDGDTKPTKAQQKKLAKFADLTVSERTTEDWYCLLRNLQGDLARTLTDAGFMVDANDFPKDSLFCEWAYVANFDKMVLEVFKGFQTKQHKSGRFADPKCKDEYKPVKLVKTFKIDKNLPQEFESWVKKEQEKDDE